MTWFKVDDTLAAHTKVRRAGLHAMGLWVVAGAHASAQLTDGFVPEWFVDTWPQGRKLAAALVKAGLWRPDEEDGEAGWRFHEWEQCNPTRAEVEATRASNAKRKRLSRDRRTEPGHTDVTPPVTRDSRVTGRVTHTDVTPPVTPPRPVPSRPEGTDGVLREGQSSPVTRDPVHNLWTRTVDNSRIGDALRAASGRPVSDQHAVAVARDVLGRTSGRPPRDPTAYVLRAIEVEPQRYLPTPTPPPFRVVNGDA